jgi:prepilin-type N-terminal cleavage/methylation domain-containing protein
MGRLGRQEGFTLLEALIAMTLLAIVTGVLMTVLSSTAHWSNDTQERTALQGEVRFALDALSQDLRQAYVGGSAAAIESAGSTQIVFDSPDRSTPFHLRRISYRLLNGELQRSVATTTNTDGPPWAFAPDFGWVRQVGSVGNSTIFTYLDASGAATTDPTAVRSVAVTLQVRPAADAMPVTYSANVTLRTTQ